MRLLSLTSNQGCRGCGRTHSAMQHSANGHSHGLVGNHSHHAHGAMGMLGASRGMATPIETPLRAGGLPSGNTDYAFEASLF